MLLRVPGTVPRAHASDSWRATTNRRFALKKDEICDSRKFVSKYVCAVTGPIQPMFEVGARSL
jgi:hypothetical protein